MHFFSTRWKNKCICTCFESAARPNRTYRLSLVARSDRRGYPDSEASNTLFLNTFTDRGRHAGTAPNPENEAMVVEDDRDLPIRVTQRTDTSLTLDWLGYLEPTEVLIKYM